LKRYQILLPLLRTTLVIAATAQIALSQAAVPSNGSQYDLNGEWQGRFTVIMRGSRNIVVERVAIQQISTKVTATKITGDEFVPAGKMTIHANYTGNPFQGEQVCAQRGYINPQWAHIRLTILNETHLKVEGSCGADVVWERIGKPTIALDTTLLFDLDKYELRPEATSTLELIKQQIEEQHPNTHLLVAGYTDSLGTDAHNLQLSTRRAQSVAGWLASHGIPQSRLTVKGFGKSNPRYPNINDDARAHNRRVEIVILG
jgi:outer membrane protein OmpA-like peptidoglycan-associated protein